MARLQSQVWARYEVHAQTIGAKSLGVAGAQFRVCCSQLMEVCWWGGLIAKGDAFAEARQSSSGNIAPLRIPCPRSADHYLIVKAVSNAAKAWTGMQSFLQSIVER